MKVRIWDPTLRDGNHAVGHAISASQIAAYATAADAAGIPVIEVGHGNGLGASSLQVGLSKTPEAEMLRTARENIHRARLAVLAVPGYATIERSLRPAIDAGVELFRLGAHCTEADLTERHAEFLIDQGVEPHGVLMMSHMVSPEQLLAQARLMQSYGLRSVTLMDSAGAYTPADAEAKVRILVENLDIEVGFHAHNNLGLAVGNAAAAALAGASIIDGTARGFGAGAGNAPIEIVAPLLERLGFETGIDLYQVLDTAQLAEERLIEQLPRSDSVTIVSGFAGVFSGYSKHVLRVAVDYGIDARDLFFELGRRRVVAGQEDVIVEEAQRLAAGRRPVPGASA